MTQEQPQTPCPQTPSPQSPPAAPQPAGKPVISYDDFAKLDLRIATVLEAGDHPNADKLFVIKVDLGGEQRQVLAGLKGHVEAASLVGRQVVVVANLQPRKMRGLESQGMLLAATAIEGDARRVVVLSPTQPVPPGSTVS
jgi:tRNA-binding protein